MPCRPSYGARWVCLRLSTISPALINESSGCYDLAAVEESFVLAFARTGDSDPNHLNVALNRAYRVSRFHQIMPHLISYGLEQLARAGSYQIALAQLLHSETWRGLSLDQYQEWAIMIWHILALRSSRR